MSADILTGSMILGAALGGVALGRGYFWALRRTASLYAGGGGGALLPVLLTVGRAAAAVLVFAVAAKSGAGAVLAAAAGFLWARSLALRAVRRSG